MEDEARKDAVQRPEAEYDPPAVERVMGQEELEREVHYAGVPAEPGSPVDFG